MHLFYDENAKRRLSLRFLAWHLLGEQMVNRMQDKHDSIEDAQTALSLYDKYVELQAACLHPQLATMVEERAVEMVDEAVESCPDAAGIREATTGRTGLMSRSDVSSSSARSSANFFVAGVCSVDMVSEAP